MSNIRKFCLYWPIIIGVIVIGISIAIISLNKIAKISKQHNTRWHVIEVKKTLMVVGINNMKKISMLKHEISIQNQKEDNLLDEIKKMIFGIFKTTLIVPIGFLFGIFFQKTESVSINDIIEMGLLLLILSIVLAYIVLLVYPSIKRVIFSPRKDRETVYKYLCDIEYLYDAKHIES